MVYLPYWNHATLTQRQSLARQQSGASYPEQIPQFVEVH